MNREAIIRNADSNIRYQEELARNGKDFSPTTIMRSERLKEVAKIEVTEEQRERLWNLYRLPNSNWMTAKDIKEALGVSWNELKLLASACGRKEVKGIRERSGLSRQEFAKKYGIPIRTLEKWERHETEPAGYIISLLDRVVEEDFG